MEIQKKAEEVRAQMGGTIFAFPVNESDPFSKYAVVVYAGGVYHTYPEVADISEAAAGVQIILEELKKDGQDVNYQKDVRFFSYDAQVNAPDVTMRRLKKEGAFEFSLQRSRESALEADYCPNPEGEGHLISARGLIKFSYLSMVQDKLPKAALFMDEYYRILAARRYGKTAAAIRQEVRRMNDDDAIRWIERTYSRFIHDDAEVIGIMQRLGGR